MNSNKTPKQTQKSVLNIHKIFGFGFVLFFGIAFGLMPLIAAAAGLVPCGGPSPEPPCTWCHLYQLGKSIIDFMMMIIIPITAIMIVYGGIMIMIAGGSPEKVKQGRSIVTAAIIGLLIALLSWLIIDTIFKVLTVQTEEGNYFENQFGPWNELRCELPRPQTQ